MKKIFASIFLIILFLSFAVFVHCKNILNNVLGVEYPNVLLIDLNNNNRFDDGERICLPDVKSFSLELNDITDSLANDLGLNTNDRIAMGYLANDYSKKLLTYSRVKVKLNGNKSSYCRYGEIFLDKDKYSDLLFNSGFVSKNGVINKEAYNQKLEIAKKLNLVLLNHKSNKYHKLDCKYGLIASDYVIIEKKDLPKEAQPCKVCHVEPVNEARYPSQQKLPDTVISTGNIKLILTDGTTNLVPDRNCTHEACKVLLDEINKAQKSIDMAVYGWDDIPKLHDAIVSARSRGVKVRVVYDEAYSPDKNYYKETNELVAIADESRSDYLTGQTAFTNILMHNKFLIFDNKTVITGSMNLSFTGLSGFNFNSILLINSNDVARLFSAEFEQMLSGKFHNLKLKPDLANNFKIGDTFLSVYFSPYDKSVEKVIPLINNAKNYIYMPIFLITHSDLTNALINAKKRGVDVRIIMDANGTSTSNSKHSLLRLNNVPLKTENYAGKMHSKSIIIDDKYVICGSMNFSNSGENKNDENMLIIENQKIAQFYKKFFLYLWDKIPNKWLIYNAVSESPESIGSCTDGIDNDFDGFVDDDDNGCFAQ